MDRFEQEVERLAGVYRWEPHVVDVIRRRREALASRPLPAARDLAERHGLSREACDALAALAPLAGGVEVPLRTPKAAGTVWEREAPAEKTLRGPTWSAFLRTNPPLDSILSAYVQLVVWVGGRHRVGEVVTALDPANVVVAPTGEVALLDPKAAPRAAWRAPEHDRGGTPASDVFVLGRLLHEALPVDGAPAALVALAARCLERRPSDRPADALLLARQLLRVLLPKEVATADGAAEVFAQVESLRAQARELVSEGRIAAAAEIDRGATELESRAEASERVRLLRALREDVGVPGLIQGLRNAHHRASARGEPADWLLDALALVDAEGQSRRYRSGEGRLTLLTEPPGVPVELFRYAEREGRLWPEPVASPGRTPLVDLALPMGSYVALLRGEVEVRYPIRIDRRTRWHGVPPEAGAPLPIVMPGPGDLGPEDVLVPAGWFRYQGRWSWCAGFVVRKTPVRVFEYLEFLAALRRQDDDEALARCSPSDGVEVCWEGGIPRLTSDLPLEGPAVGVPYAGALAFAAWRSARDTFTWRLPTDKEWEKAARGVDGRSCPWGEHVDPSFAHYDAAVSVPVEAYPSDSSPYGVRGLAGNAADWIDAPAPEGFAVARGGHYASRADGVGAAAATVLPDHGSRLVGFRLVRSDA